jgi:8-oxo-dGTP pyrophosphatase MutT (NUDIX family)
VKRITRKAFAYITHENRLLIFSHPHEPEAGLQVPAGTLLDGESPENGALREAQEETGLSGLRVVRFLGDVKFDRAGYDGLDEIHHRFFFRLVCNEGPPERWRHYESDPSDGSEPPLFELWWVKIPDEVPALIAGHDEMLPVLYEALMSG